MKEPTAVGWKGLLPFGSIVRPTVRDQADSSPWLLTALLSGSTRSRHLESPRRRENSKCRCLRTASRRPGRQRIADANRRSVPAVAAPAVLRQRGRRRLRNAPQLPPLRRLAALRARASTLRADHRCHAPFAASQETRRGAAPVRARAIRGATNTVLRPTLDVRSLPPVPLSTSFGWTMWKDSWSYTSPRARAGQLAIVSQVTAAHIVSPH
jgi:hypothetical protein